MTTRITSISRRNSESNLLPDNSSLSVGPHRSEVMRLNRMLAAPLRARSAARASERLSGTQPTPSSRYCWIVALSTIISVGSACSLYATGTGRSTVIRSDSTVRPALTSGKDATSARAGPTGSIKERKIREQAPSQEAATPADDRTGITPSEYSKPNRWGLTSDGSQRNDWLGDDGH